MLLTPAILFLMGFLVGILWYVTRRQNAYLAFMALGLMSFALAFLLQIYYIAPHAGSKDIYSIILYSMGASFLALGMMRRSSIMGGYVILTTVSVGICATTWWYSAIEPDIRIRVYVMNFGLGLLMLYPCLRTRSLIQGNLADKLLFWSILFVAAHFFVRTILTANSVDPNAGLDFSQSTFWVWTVYVAGGLSALLGMCILAVTALDFITLLEKERDRDSLTNVLNRRGLDRYFADRHLLTTPICVMICDLDYFKSVNDTFGHDAGDQILHNFAQNLSAIIGRDGTVGRLGGEEFVVILPRTTLHHASWLAHRIRSSQVPLPPAMDGSEHILTCSIGVVQLRANETVQDALKRADTLLYNAKNLGRDRTITEADHFLETQVENSTPLASPK